MKKTTKRAAMREVLATWQSSGLSLKAFGEREGIAYAKLLYWKKRLAEEPSFAPVRIVESSPEAAEPRAEVISIWLANGVSLEVPSTVAESDLARAVPLGPYLRQDSLGLNGGTPLDHLSSRFGVITEGPADAILLPSLLRQANSLARLPYRIVPGLSEASRADVRAFSYQGGSIVCLADGDPGGLEVCKKLREEGIPVQSILHLGVIYPGCTLEDLVDAGVFADAINIELDAWGLGPFRVSASDLPNAGRWPWVLEQGVAWQTPTDQLSKPRVAQRVVDLGRATSQEIAGRTSIFEEKHLEGLRQLHDRICVALGAPP